jgi:hypothetical protein
MLSIVRRQRSASVILYKLELTSDINIVPGLSGLNLNILHAIDMHMIDNAKHTIFKYLYRITDADRCRCTIDSIL